ncbi:MAG: hypothetical protein ABIE68_03460 [bacterium]
MISKGYKKHLRKAKARLRREILDEKELQEKLKNLYQGLEKDNE